MNSHRRNLTFGQTQDPEVSQCEFVYPNAAIKQFEWAGIIN